MFSTATFNSQLKMTNETNQVKIFIPNFSPSNDYNAANSVGELVIMTRGILMISPEQMHEKFRRFFETAEEGDILMFSGSHLACCTAYAEWCKRFPEARNIMIYNKPSNVYELSVVTG